MSAVNPRGTALSAWQFYVYELVNPDGSVAYVGKGSGLRLRNQKRKFGLDGREVARFKSEKHCYAFERERIAESGASLNKHPGGNGSRARPTRKSRSTYLADIERIGTRRYAVLLLARFAPHLLRTEHINALR